MHIRLLVTDYDDCAFSVFSDRTDNLSQPIIDMACSGKYDGFYACTHRTYVFIDNLKWLVTNKRGIGYDTTAIKQNFPTYKITEHFSAATHLPNMAVSIVDDVVYKKCGIAYEKILKPYEVSNQRPSIEMAYLSRYGAAIYFTNKNNQLLQIAKHAAEKFPDAEIVLDYVDDIEMLCKQAIYISNSAEWPKNVFLNTYHYAHQKVTPVYEPERFFEASDEIPEAWVNNALPLGAERSALLANSMFGNTPSAGSKSVSCEKVTEIQAYSP